MTNINKPYTFSANTTASSSQVNDNFDTIYNDYNGGISSTNLADGAVTAAKIGTSAVTTVKLDSGAVTPPKLDSDLQKGWTTDTQTWTYVSATSFKITGTDVTAQFPVGTKIKLTQTTAKYFYVTAATFSTDTTVTVTGGTDYTLANAAITSPMYSYMATPQGFPQWFNRTPTWTNLTVGNGTVVAKFTMKGKTVDERIHITFGTTSAISGDVSVSTATTRATYGGTGNITPIGYATFYDVSAVAIIYGVVGNSTTTVATIRAQNSASTYLAFALLSSTVPFTWANTDEMGLTLSYESA